MSTRVPILVCLLAALTACDGDAPPPATPSDAGTDAGTPHVPMPFEPTEATRAYCGDRDDDAIEARITTLLAQLTLREKVTLMHGSAFGVTSTWEVEGHEGLGIPGFHMLDGPRGVSSARELPATTFPVAMMRGATWSPELEQRIGAAMAVETLSVGADVLLAPTINILRHPRWGRAQETYGEDTHHMGEMAVSFIRGVQSEGVLASAKHFAANSIEDTRFTVDVQVDERTLREIYLPHFHRAVTEARVASVMSAYNSVNGLHCDMQPQLLRDILKDEWGFAGFVESDWIFGTHAASESVLAGLDLEMPTGNWFDRLPREAAAGEITEHDLDAAVRRILRAQFCFGLDERTPVADDPTQRETTEHLALAREAAERGIVLLRNEPPTGTPAGTPRVLPLATTMSSVLVLGRNADVENVGDHGSSNVTSTDVITALEGLRERAMGGVTVTHLPSSTPAAEVETAIRAADVVVIVTGLQHDDEGEQLAVSGGDRTDLAVPAAELALIESTAAIHPAVVVVLEGSGPFITRDWDTRVAAVLHAFYPGQQGGRALAAILFGDFSPTGRLPFSMPEQESDLPAFDNTSDRVVYTYLHGYRWLEDQATPARYPFGFGLSYTTFTYENLRLSAASIPADGTAEITFTVTNTGTTAGTETPQLYVSAVGSAVERAPRDLRAFTQVTLAPAESRDVTLTLRAADLAYYDVTARAWQVEPIDYTVHVGPNAATSALSTTLHVD